MSTSTSLLDRFEDPPAPLPLVDPSPPRFSASTNPHPQAPDAAMDADRLRNPDGRCLSPVTFHLADDALPTFLPDWPPTAPHPPHWPTDAPYPLDPWPSPPESRSTTPDYHYDSCDDLCAASCNINTVLTLYGKPPPRSPQPVNSWPSLPDHDHWPDAPGTPFIPSNPHPTRAHTPITSSRLDDPWTMGPLIADQPEAYRKIWAYDWKDREIPVWVARGGLWYNSEPLHLEEEYQALKKQYQATLQEFLDRVKIRTRIDSDYYP